MFLVKRFWINISSTIELILTWCKTLHEPFSTILKEIAKHYVVAFESETKIDPNSYGTI